MKQIFIKHQVKGKSNSYRHNVTHHRLEKWTPSILNAQSFQTILTINITIINMIIACYVLATTCCVRSINRRPAKLSRLMNSIENKTLLYVMPHCPSVLCNVNVFVPTVQTPIHFFIINYIIYNLSIIKNTVCSYVLPISL